VKDWKEGRKIWSNCKNCTDFGQSFILWGKWERKYSDL